MGEVGMIWGLIAGAALGDSIWVTGSQVTGEGGAVTLDCYESSADYVFLNWYQQSLSEQLQ